MRKINLKTIIYLVISVVSLIIAVDSFVTQHNAPTKISYSEAVEMIESQKISSVTLVQNTLKVLLYSEVETEEGIQTQEYEAQIPDIVLFTELIDGLRKEKDVSEIKYEVLPEEEKTIGAMLASVIAGILPTLLIYGLFIIVMRKMFSSEGLTGEKKEIKPENTSKYSFNDIAGINNELFEVMEVVNMLKYPSKYKSIGAKIPKGILLVGEPGTGKTLIAKAIAREAGVNFYNCAGSSFENVYVGLGASKVRKLFEEARKNAPSIIFIDEIDALAKKRYSGSHSEQTLNQLLSEMDGFTESDNIILIAATNYAEVLDPAITRPGRFDRIINISLPDCKGRYEILEVHSKNKTFENPVEKAKILASLAKKTSGKTGAILENILNEAAIMAVRNNRDYISQEEVDEAFIKELLGISKEDQEVSENKKILTAYHEAGHAVAGRIKRPNVEILQVSIVPRGTAGGYTLFGDKPDNLTNKEDLTSDVVVSLGGRAAEQNKFGTISIGASSDLEHATKIAHRMVYSFAMGNDTQLVRIYAESDYNTNLESEMFNSMKKIVDDAYTETLGIIKNNENLVKDIAEALIEKSTLNSEEIEELFSRYGV